LIPIGCKLCIEQVKENEIAMRLFPPKRWNL